MAKEQIENMEILLKLDCSTYYDVNKCYSYNAFLNVIMGGRGLGKTTQFLISALNRRKKYGEEFIYLRRYKTETSTTRDVLSNLVDEVNFKGDKNGGGTWYWKGNRLGYCIPLSVAPSYKSKVFDKVRTIIYDEAIIKKGGTQRYLPNEVTALLEFMSTVFRHRLGVRTICLGNNLDFFNPYCEYFNVKVFNKFYYNKEQGIYIEYSNSSPALKIIEETTPLFNLTKGTAYHEYHYNNAVISDKNVSTSKKRNNDKLLLALNINNYALQFYKRHDGHFLVEFLRKKSTFEYCFTLVDNDTPNYYDCQMFKKKFKEFMLFKYYNDELDYDSQDSYNLMLSVLDILE